MFETERQKIHALLRDLFGQKYERVLIAIAGPPGAGKSTLAAMLVSDLNGQSHGSAALVPMDGYHLDNAILDERGLRDRKGAPETFDGDGFVDLVRRLRGTPHDIAYPIFDRAKDCAVFNGASVNKSVKWVVLEGNYLLLSQKPWVNLQPLLDLTISIRPSMGVLSQRLVTRWREYGFSLEQAEQKALGNDIPNAKFVIKHSVKADIAFGSD